MNTVLEQIIQQSGTTPGLTMVVGAGNGSNLSLLRQLESPRLVLIEAHPRQAEQLMRRARSEQGEEVRQFAVTASSCGNGVLHALNNLNYSSLKLPQALLEHFPNIRITEQLDVSTCTLEDAISGLAPVAQERNLLILNAPGQALDLLRNTPASAIQIFAWLIVHLEVEPLYGPDNADGDIVAQLQELGFEPAGEDLEAIYPQATLLFARNENRIQIHHFEAKIRQLNDELAFVRERAAEESASALIRIEEISKARDTQDQLTSKFQLQFDAQKLEISTIILAQETIGHKNYELTAALHEQTKISEELQIQVNTLTSENAELLIQRELMEMESLEVKVFHEAYPHQAVESPSQLEPLNKAKKDHQSLQVQDSEKNESYVQQQLLREQLLKAEAQIELIKDLLLREPGI